MVIFLSHSHYLTTRNLRPLSQFWCNTLPLVSYYQFHIFFSFYLNLLCFSLILRQFQSWFFIFQNFIVVTSCLYHLLTYLSSHLEPWCMLVYGKTIYTFLWWFSQSHEEALPLRIRLIYYLSLKKLMTNSIYVCSQLRPSNKKVVSAPTVCWH